MLESLLVTGTGPEVKKAELAVERLGIDLCAPPKTEGDASPSLEDVLSTAERTGAKGIWAGGLTSEERTRWAERTRAKELVFIGPNHEALTILRSRVAQRDHARSVGLAVPANSAVVCDLESAKVAAAELTFPLWLRSNQGEHGGEPVQLASIEELEATFGESEGGDLVLERVIPHARFLELTVIRDQDGKTLRMPECETSLQDARGTVVCEMPSAVFHFHPDGDELRDGLRDSAEAYASEMKLVGAVTLLFLLGRDGNCWFSEARSGSGSHNLKSQLLSQVDPLEQEIRVAAGESVAEASLLAPFGHALSARLRAEGDGVGKIELVFPPLSISKARVEHLAKEQAPDLAHVASHGATRHGAILGLDRMLAGTQVPAGSSNRDRLRELLNDESFRAGLYDASFRKNAETPDP